MKGQYVYQEPPTLDEYGNPDGPLCSCGTPLSEGENISGALFQCLGCGKITDTGEEDDEDDS